MSGKPFVIAAPAAVAERRLLARGGTYDAGGCPSRTAGPPQGQAAGMAGGGFHIARGQGDCEDFAIAKYLSLRYSGIPTAKLRLVYVKATLTRAIGPYRPPPGAEGKPFTQAHRMLAFYPTPDAEPLVLDNLIMEFKPASQRRDLQPIFSFNSDAIWNGVAGSAARGSGGPGTLSRWADLLLRARSEGFD
ncbi:MAG: hypothetical protein ABIK82_22125 [Pseudomonadota bacterium]